MENFRKGVLFFLGIVFFMAVTVSVYAETVEEKKAAANYDETLPNAQEARPVENATQPAVAPVPSVQSAPVAPQTSQAPVPVAAGTPYNPAVLTALPGSPVVAGGQVQAAPVPVAPPAVPAQAVVVAPQAPQGATSPDLPVDQVLSKPNPSGLIEVSGYKYPVYLFVPKDYKTDRTYAMIMLAPAESAKAEKQIEYLSGLAERRSIFILAPYVLWPNMGDTPYNLDQWLLTVKKDVIERYPISPKRVYLIGKDSGGHYAAYMGVKYPREFAAVALLGEAWDGQFSQLVDPLSDAADQVPFFIAMKTDGKAKARNQVWFDKLQQKGYPLHLVDYNTDEDLTQLEFKKTVFDWLESTSQSWAVTRAQNQKGWKAKFKKGVKDFFAV